MAKSEEQQRSDKGDNKLVVRWFIAAAVLIALAAIVFNQVLKDRRGDAPAASQTQEHQEQKTPNPTGNPTPAPSSNGTAKP